MRSDLQKMPINAEDDINQIAEVLGLDLKQLKDFHNLNSFPHEWIKDDNKFPAWLEYLYIPDSETNLKENKNKRESPTFVSLKQSEIDSCDYKINQKIDVQVSGSSMIDSETEILWKFKKIKRGNTFYADICQKSHQVKYIKSIYRQFAEYMQKFNKPMEHLIIELFSNGAMKSLENQDEVRETWNALKLQLKPELGNTLEEENMIEGGDKDFSDTFPLIKNNILYRLFLNDVFQDYLELNRFVELEKQSYTSQIFANEEVILLKKRKVEKDGDIVKIKFLSEADPHKNKHLQQIYNTKLKDFLQEEYDYSLTWSAEYHFDTLERKMFLCYSKIKEQASSKYCHVTEHKIELLKINENG